MGYILGVCAFYTHTKITGNQGKGFFSICWTQADASRLLFLVHLNVSSLYTGQTFWGY